MKKIKIGVLCPSEIALRRFMPAVMKCDDFEYVGVAAATEREYTGIGSDDIPDYRLEKTDKFISALGGKLFRGYTSMITSGEIDAVYIPLPPALHFRWAEAALKKGKHVLLEKPFTTCLSDTKALTELAKSKKLALHENFMFMFHSQIEWIKQKLSEGVIGDIRLIRIDFGFPFRGGNDFRYDKKMGGGALLDCGCYTVKLASMLLGDTAKITTSQLNSKMGFDVDVYGSATLLNDDGLTAQVSFGMDNSYRCDLNVWGSTGTLSTGRIITAPAGFIPTVVIKNANGEQTFELSSDDTFRKSIDFFGKCIKDDKMRMGHYEEILRQSAFIDEFERK